VDLGCADEEVAVRWQRLFADLSAQFDSAEEAAERAEAASRARVEIGAVRLTERLRGALGGDLVLRCRGAGQVAGRLTEVGPDWLLLDDERGGELLVAASAVVAVAGLGRLTAAPAEPGVVRDRLDLRWAVRAVARDRSTVQVLLVDGGRLTGTVDRVGADFCELAEHPEDEPRRPGAVRSVQAVALTGIALVRTVRPRLD
jgi:hypothetical protein